MSPRDARFETLDAAIRDQGGRALGPRPRFRPAQPRKVTRAQKLERRRKYLAETGRWEQLRKEGLW